MTKYYLTIFLVMVLAIQLCSASTVAHAIPLTQGDHMRCQTKGYIKKSLRYQRCLGELQIYNECRRQNKKVVAPYNTPHKNQCSKQANKRFLKHLTENTHKEFSVTYENEPEKSYHIAIEDKAQYNQRELEQIKNQFILQCIKERQKQRANLLKSLPNCENKLRVAK